MACPFMASNGALWRHFVISRRPPYTVNEGQIIKQGLMNQSKQNKPEPRVSIQMIIVHVIRTTGLSQRSFYMLMAFGIKLGHKTSYGNSRFLPASFICCSALLRSARNLEQKISINFYEIYIYELDIVLEMYSFWYELFYGAWILAISAICQY